MTDKTQSNAKANEAEVLIAAAMNNEHAQQNRQAKLTLYMFSNEVSYSADELTKLFKATGSDRTDIVATMLTRISEQYAETQASIANLTEKKKADKLTFSEREALQLESLNGRVRAANMLFTRAATGVLHLRTIGAYGLKVTANGALSFHYVVRDDKGAEVRDPKGNVTSTFVTVSGNTLVKAGQKHVDTLKPAAKAKAGGERASAPKVGIAPITSAVRDRVKQVRNQPDAAGYEGMSDEEVKGLDELLHELLIAKFGDKSGKLDRATLLDYLDDEFPQAQTKPQNGNGTQKPKAA